MQFVLAGAVGDKTSNKKFMLAVSFLRIDQESFAETGVSLIVFTTQLAHHIPQREDRAEDQFGIVIRAAGRVSGALGHPIAHSRCLRRRTRWFAANGHWTGKPAATVDTLRCDTG